MDKLKGRIVEVCGSQREFAKRINVSESLISRRLRGEISWSAKDVFKAADVLKIPDEELRSYFFTLTVENKATAEAV